MEMLTGSIAFFLMTAIIEGINLDTDLLTRLPLRQLVGEQTVVALRAVASHKQWMLPVNIEENGYTMTNGPSVLSICEAALSQFSDPPHSEVTKSLSVRTAGQSAPIGSSNYLRDFLHLVEGLRENGSSRPAGERSANRPSSDRVRIKGDSETDGYEFYLRFCRITCAIRSSQFRLLNLTN